MDRCHQRQSLLGQQKSAGKIVPWVALSEGEYTTPDGRFWEVAKFELSGLGRWADVSFQSTFAKSPHVFLTVQTQNGGPV